MDWVSFVYGCLAGAAIVGIGITISILLIIKHAVDYKEDDSDDNSDEGSYNADNSPKL